MGGFSIWHIIIIAIFVMLLFGGNRFSAMMGDVAKGLKSFKQGMADDEDEKTRRYEEQRRNEPPRQLPRTRRRVSRSMSRRVRAEPVAASAAETTNPAKPA